MKQPQSACICVTRMPKQRWRSRWARQHALTSTSGLLWLTNTLQAALIVYFYPERMLTPGNAPGAAEVKSQAEARIGAMLDQLDAELARHGGPWFAGTRYSALDAYVFTLCRWTRNFSSPAARTRPQLGPYLQRMLARPAALRVLSAEELAPPFV